MPTRLTGISLLLNNEQQEKIQDKAKNSAEALYILADCVVFDQPKKLIAALVTKKKLVTLTFSFNEGLILVDIGRFSKTCIFAVISKKMMVLVSV